MRSRRADPVPYTVEDSDVWVCVGLWSCFAFNDYLELNSAWVDRHDADRMLEWTRGRVYGLGGDLYVRTFPWVLAGTTE